MAPFNNRHGHTIPQTASRQGMRSLSASGTSFGFKMVCPFPISLVERTKISRRRAVPHHTVLRQLPLPYQLARLMGRQLPLVEPTAMDDEEIETRHAALLLP
ncbi:hypothetical protein V2G26_006925 [Clonostachys chloroleuca]